MNSIVNESTTQRQGGEGGPTNPASPSDVVAALRRHEWVRIMQEAADLIEQQAERIKELEAENKNLTRHVDVLRVEKGNAVIAYERERDALAALRQRIADAPVVAWEYALCSPNAVLDRQASHVNWDERYQPFGRLGVDYATGAHVQKRPLISKEDI